MHKLRKIVLVKVERLQTSHRVRAVRIAVKRVVSNTVISLIGQAVTSLSTLLLTIAYGYFLGDVRFGQLYFASAFVLLIGAPVERGFNPQLTREVAQNPGVALRYLSSTLAIKVSFWGLTYGCIILCSMLLGYNGEERTLILISGLTLLTTALTNTFAAMHYAHERVIFSVLGGILEKAISALVGVVLLWFGAGIEIMALVLLAASLINCVWQAIWFYRLSGMYFKVEKKIIREIVGTSLPFLVYAILGVIYYRIDTLLLSLMTNEAVVGWYGAIYRIFEMLFFIPNLIIMNIMYPVFSKLSIGSEKNLKVALEKSVNFLLFCSVPMATGLIVAAPQIVTFLYHRSEFLHSIPALQALAPGLIFLYLNTALNSVLVSTKREKKMIIMAIIALIFNLGLNFVLIPRYLHVGAALVTSLTELVLVLINSVFLPRALLPLGSLVVGLKTGIASIIMAAVIWLLRDNSILVIIPIASAVYLGIAILIEAIPRQDLQMLYTSVRYKARPSL